MILTWCSLKSSLCDYDLWLVLTSLRMRYVQNDTSDRNRVIPHLPVLSCAWQGHEPLQCIIICFLGT